MIVRFHIVAPAAKKRSLSVRLPILLGRGEDAKFRIQHDLVSRKHCELFAADGRVFVRDLGSTNGTFLNDEQVPASVKTPVPHGAMIRVGGLSFRVEYEQSESVPAVADGGHESGTGGTDNPRTVAFDLRQFAPQAAAGATAEPDFSVEQSQDDALPLSDFTAEPADEPAAAGFAPPEVNASGDGAAADGCDPALTTAPPEPKHEPEQAAGDPVFPGPAPQAAATGDFGFLDAAGGTPAAAGEPAPAWPAAEAAAADTPDDTPDDGPDDDALNSFFKGLK